MVKIDRTMIWGGIRITLSACLGAWVGWALMSYTIDVVKRDHKVTPINPTNNVVEVVWTNMKVVDGVYNKVVSNNFIKGDAIVVLGLREDGVVVWKFK